MTYKFLKASEISVGGFIDFDFVNNENEKYILTISTSDNMMFSTKFVSDHEDGDWLGYNHTVELFNSLPVMCKKFDIDTIDTKDDGILSFNFRPENKDFMLIEDAIEIVLDLARQRCGNKNYTGEEKIAINVVEDFYANVLTY